MMDTKVSKDKIIKRRIDRGNLLMKQYRKVYAKKRTVIDKVIKQDTV